MGDLALIGSVLLLCAILYAREGVGLRPQLLRYSLGDLFIQGLAPLLYRFAPTLFYFFEDFLQ